MIIYFNIIIFPQKSNGILYVLKKKNILLKCCFVQRKTYIVEVFTLKMSFSCTTQDKKPHIEKNVHPNCARTANKPCYPFGTPTFDPLDGYFFTEYTKPILLATKTTRITNSQNKN